MTRIALTPTEALVLNGIAHHESNAVGGATPKKLEDIGVVYNDCIRADGMTAREIVETLKTLRAKHCIETYGEGTLTLSMTTDGFAAWQESRNPTGLTANEHVAAMVSIKRAVQMLEQHVPLGQKGLSVQLDTIVTDLRKLAVWHENAAKRAKI